VQTAIYLRAYEREHQYFFFFFKLSHTKTHVKCFLTHPVFFPTGQCMLPSSYLSYPCKSCYTLPRPPAAFTILLIFVLHFLLFFSCVVH